MRCACRNKRKDTGNGGGPGRIRAGRQKPLPLASRQTHTYTDIHTTVHTQKYTNIHSYTHIHPQSHMPIHTLQICVCIPTCNSTCRNVHIHTYNTTIHTIIHTHKWPRTNIHIHAYRQLCTHANIHMRGTSASKIPRATADGNRVVPATILLLRWEKGWRFPPVENALNPSPAWRLLGLGSAGDENIAHVHSLSINVQQG